MQRIGRISWSGVALSWPGLAQVGVNRLVSVKEPGDNTASSNGLAHFARISDDGNFVVFLSEGTDITAATQNSCAHQALSEPCGARGGDAFVRNLLTNTTRLISYKLKGNPPPLDDQTSIFYATAVNITPDGHYALFNNVIPSGGSLWDLTNHTGDDNAFNDHVLRADLTVDPVSHELVSVSANTPVVCVRAKSRRLASLRTPAPRTIYKGLLNRLDEGKRNGPCSRLLLTTRGKKRWSSFFRESLSCRDRVRQASRFRARHCATNWQPSRTLKRIDCVTVERQELGGLWVVVHCHELARVFRISDFSGESFFDRGSVAGDHAGVTKS